MPNLKFGCKPSPPDPRHLKFARYLLPGLPEPPQSSDWGDKVNEWTMMGNGDDADNPDIKPAGDCVFAAAGHAEMTWTSNAAGLYIPQAKDIIAAYAIVTGYNPATGANDNGSDPTTMLKFWRDTGVAGHTIGAWAMLDPHNPLHFRRAISMFECNILSLQLPTNFSFDWTEWTDVSGDQDPNAGHEVLAVKYNPDGVWVVSWGQLYFVSWAFLARFCVEAEVIFSDDLFVPGSPAPTGFDRGTLLVDLQLVTAA